MGVFIVVVIQPDVQIFLQRFRAVVYLPAECRLIELLENGLMEALSDTIGLWVARFRASMLDLIEHQVKLVIVLLDLATIFRATVSQDT